MLVKKYWIHCFLLLLIADTISAAVDWKGGHFFFKSLLMPVLMIGLLHHKRVTAEKNWRLILAGLITAWAGDVLLLFSEDRQQFFMFGLVCFLCTHLAYILYFSRYHRGIFLYIKGHLLLTAIVVLYAVLLLLFLWNGLGSLLIPVVIYTVLITTMVLQSFAAKNFSLAKRGNQFVAGAIMFVVSDSVLAIAKFHKPFLLSDAAIILTYGIAQLLIVDSAVKNTDKKQVYVSA